MLKWHYYYYYYYYYYHHHHDSMTAAFRISVICEACDSVAYFYVLQGSSVEQEEEPVEEGKEKEKAKAENQPEPLLQLITAFSRSATTEATVVLEGDFLYISYATIMGQVHSFIHSFIFVR